MHALFVLQVAPGVNVDPVQRRRRRPCPPRTCGRRRCRCRTRRCRRSRLALVGALIQRILPAGTEGTRAHRPVSAQDAQVPAQAVPQQTPWAQKFARSRLAIRRPVRRRAAAAPAHAQVRRHAVAVRAARRPAGGRRGVAEERIAEGARHRRQTPAPSQVRWGVGVDPTHRRRALRARRPKRHAPAPLQVPSVPHVAAAVAAHCVGGEGAVPLATLLHVPGLPLIAHDCTYRCTPRCSRALRAEPRVASFASRTPCRWASGCRAGVTDIGRRPSPRRPCMLSGMHHRPRRNRRCHTSSSWARRRRRRRHTRARRGRRPVQLAAPHYVPLGYLRHPPAPLQVPSLPQVEGAAIGHCAATSGGSPAGIGEHVPTLPESAQDMQVPVHALLQQTLLTQSGRAVRALPGRACPADRDLPAAHRDAGVSGCAVGRRSRAPGLAAGVPHWYGAHELVVAGRQAPRRHTNAGMTASIPRSSPRRTRFRLGTSGRHRRRCTCRRFRRRWAPCRCTAWRSGRRARATGGGSRPVPSGCTPRRRPRSRCCSRHPARSNRKRTRAAGARNTVHSCCRRADAREHRDAVALLAHLVMQSVAPHT